MTTLHHYQCPVTKALLQETDINFAGIIVNGVSELYDDKVFTAARTGDIAACIGADGAIVEIDGWGNHHIDFVSVIEQLGKRGIPAVGLSYIGLQGRLVCTNDYVDTIVDFNKNESGYESCIVGDNNVDVYDAAKAVALMKLQMKRRGIRLQPVAALRGNRLLRKKYAVHDVRMGTKTELSQGVLTIDETCLAQFIDKEARLRRMLALVDGHPRVLTLKEVLTYYLAHQKEVITRRCRFELDKALARAHILEGLLIALDHIDEVIRTIRSSQTDEIAKNALMKNFGLSEKQSVAILDMRLRRLTGLEREKIEEEYKELEERIAYLRSVLADEHKIMQVERGLTRSLLLIRPSGKRVSNA